MILKNLWRRKTRTLLTLLGVAVGVAAVVALSAFGEGIAGGFEKMFGASVADLTVGQKDALMLMLSTLDESVGDELRQVRGVREVAGTVIGVVQMSDAPYFIVMGEDPRGFAMRRYRLIAGGPLVARRQILIGKITAKNFEKGVGDTFRINDQTYRIVGIYETGVSLEDGGAVMTLQDAQRAFGKREQVSYFALKVDDLSRTDEIKREIETHWSDLAATRSGDATRQTEMLGLYRSFGLFLGIFAALVGGLGMMNTMLMSVLERTREIGVLRALGWTRRRVIGLILGEALTLTLIGGALGVGLGVGLTELARLSPQVESLLQGVFTPYIFAQAVGVAVVLGVIGGLYPAWRASQLTPIEAMRYDAGSGDEHAGWVPRIPGLGALRNLWRRPARTLVTLLGIGIGVGFIVALIGMVEGVIATFNELASMGQVDLMAEQADTSDISLSEIDERLADRVARHPEVRSISKIFFGFPSQPGLTYFFVFGLDPREEYIRHYRIREGRMIQRSGEIVVGRFAANSLKKGIGDRINLSGKNYTIVGIYENGATYEDAGGMMWLRDAQEAFGKQDKISLLGIRVKDSARAEAVARQLEAEFPDLLIAQSSQFTERLQDFATMYAIFNALIVLTLVVGGVVMTNAMLMAVFERTQEIGVLRALGWRRGRVIQMVLAESLALSVLSALVGIGLGAGLSYLLTLVPEMGQFLAPAYTPRLFVQVAILAVSLGALGGLYPAWRAAGLRPIEALRYE
jgi:ABC-type antimicrobial peptide transport system permease subunit